MKKEHAFFPLLEGMRGLAALFVAARHMFPDFVPISFPMSYLAVDFFFLLSGVVIANAYEKRLASGFMSVATFVKLRIIRLYPLYILGLALGVLFMVGKGADWTSASPALVFNALFLPAWSTEFIFSFNPPAWSLFFELAINIAYAVVLVRCSNKVLSAAAILSLLCLAYAVFQNADQLDLGDRPTDFGWGFPRVILSFCVGVLMWRLYDRQRSIVSAAVAPTAPVGSIVLLLALSIVLGYPVAGIAARESYVLVCVAVVFPAIVYGSLWAHVPAWLEGPMRTLGIVSYPLYILHAPVYYLFKGLSHKALGIDTSVYAPYSGLALLLAFAVGAFYVFIFFDVPTRRMLSSKRRTPQPAER